MMITDNLETKLGIDTCSFVREVEGMFKFPCGLEVSMILAVGFPEELWPRAKDAHQMHHWVCESVFGAGHHGAVWTFSSTLEHDQKGDVTERIICPE